MHKFFVNEKQVNNNEIIILGQDVSHIKNVLRLNEGKKIQICNIDDKKNYISEIYEILEKEIKCRILEELESKQESNVQITIFQGLPKFEKMDLIIEKGVELGVSEITPVIMKRSIVKLDENAKKKKLIRWQKIAETAAKQSKRDIIPKVNNIIDIKEIVNLRKNYDLMILAYEEEKINSLKMELKKIKNNNLKIGIIIGPEGGIEKSEVDFLQENDVKIITLGNRILRTETASIVIASIIMYELD